MCVRQLSFPPQFSSFVKAFSPGFFLLLFSLLSGPFWVGESENGRANSGMKRSIFRAVHTHNALAGKKSNDGC